MSQKPFILSFTDIRATDLPLVGGKGANLGELTHAGFPVPPGFCLTTKAFQEFIDSCPEAEELYAQLATVTADDVEHARKVGQHVRQTLLDVPMPQKIADAKRKVYDTEGLPTTDGLGDDNGKQGVPVSAKQLVQNIAGLNQQALQAVTEHQKWQSQQNMHQHQHSTHQLASFMHGVQRATIAATAPNALAVFDQYAPALGLFAIPPPPPPPPLPSFAPFSVLQAQEEEPADADADADDDDQTEE